MRYAPVAVLGGRANFGDVMEEALDHLERLESLSWLARWGEEITEVEQGALRGVRALASSRQDFTATVAAYQLKPPLWKQLQAICPTNPLLVTEWGMCRKVQYAGLKYYYRSDTSALSFDSMAGHSMSRALLEDISYWLPATTFKGIQTLNFCHLQGEVMSAIFEKPTIWMALYDAGIQPLEFAADFITDPMVDYLSSFATLKYLYLTELRDREQTGIYNSEKVATKFYKKVLRAHKETLEVLVVDVPIQGPWFLQHNNFEDLFVCRILKKLAIPLPYPTGEIKEDLLYRVLNLREWLPHLHQLSILTSPGIWRFESSIRAFMGTGPAISALGTRSTQFSTQIEADANERVLRYVI
ncbi:hypothetical protein BDN72DRAFT_864312 [Pluteus cervinus]|uniref:Uncharacterized protein n=1 Tax=Pluteus cervinus TaxID=181527 RepID=A0ACD3A4B1_9AGAR|nr:hypothetical protein BDN72DRAFT_864312 [Pluteus cervinus]